MLHLPLNMNLVMCLASHCF